MTWNAANLAIDVKMPEPKSCNLGKAGFETREPSGIWFENECSHFLATLVM